MKNDKKLLDGIISDYFNSVEDLFNFRIKNEWKINISILIFVFSFMFAVFNILPIIPKMSDEYLLFLFRFIKNNFNAIPVQEFNFWTKWALGSIFSLVILGLAYIPYKYWDIKDKKKALKPYLMRFCYAFTLRKEIKSYLINDNETHLEKIVDFFKKIILPITTFRLENKDKTSIITLDKLKTELNKQFDLIDFNSESNKYIKSISKIDLKITKRLERKIELDKIVPLIELLTLYEFSKIKPEEKNGDGIELKARKNDFLKIFIEELEKIEEIEIVPEEDTRKRIKIISSLNVFINLFSSHNIIVLFVSWLILLTILFVASSIMIINILNLTIDSTLLIGLLTAPFIGAITLVATIYNKNKT